MAQSLQSLCRDQQTIRNLVLGLTGNPGAGKTEAAKIFEDYGSIIINGDELGYRMLHSTSPIFHQIVKSFGDSILTQEGEINRTALGEIVFNDPNQLHHLNQLIHPPMIQEIQKQADSFRQANTLGPLIIDAALIFEWEIAHIFDGIIVVTATQSIRQKRYCESKRVDPTVFLKREQSQFSDLYKRKHADFVIQNNGNRLELKHKIWQLMNENLKKA